MNGWICSCSMPGVDGGGNRSEGKTWTTSTTEKVPAGISAYGVMVAYFGRCSPVIA